MIFKTNRSEPKPDYENLVAFLTERFDEDLRWIASFNTDSYRYRMHYIRDDLKTELSTHEFDTIVHRSIALFQRPHVEEVYTHLGAANSLILEHERATAVHLYLTDTDGLIIKIKAGNEISVPGFVDECLDVLYHDGD